MILALESVAKTYTKSGRPLNVLDRIDLSLVAGEFVAIEGASGCGKSTLLLAAGGLLAPDRGKVQVASQNLYAMPPDSRARVRAREIGFVFQQFHLVPYLSVLDNVLLPLAAGAADGSRASAKASARERAMELVERFGLFDRASHLPSELSIGERQRTALARALLRRPKLLLADEPTGNLDAANADIVFACFREFAQGGGAVLLVTHDARAGACANRRFRLASGLLAPLSAH